MKRLTSSYCIGLKRFVESITIAALVFMTVFVWPAVQAAENDLPIIALQSHSSEIRSRDIEGDYRLINLNPAVGVWYILIRNNLGLKQYAHLQAIGGNKVKLSLKGETLIVEAASNRSVCSMAGDSNALFKNAAIPWTSTCSPDLVVRHKIVGFQTNKESITHRLSNSRMAMKFMQWLNSYLFVRSDLEPLQLMSEKDSADAFVKQSGKPMVTVGDAVVNPGNAKQPLTATNGNSLGETSPKTPELQPQLQKLVPQQLDLALAKLGLPLRQNDKAKLGGWHEIQGVPHSFATAIFAGAIKTKIKYPSTETRNMVYMMAYDLAYHRVEFFSGTDRPELGWSGWNQPPEKMSANMSAKMPATGNNSKNEPNKSGADGFNSAKPLKRNGIIPFWQATQLSGVFAGGMDGNQSLMKNQMAASDDPYAAKRFLGQKLQPGFVENGVSFSHLEPGFATFYSLIDGTLGMKIWTKEDQTSLANTLIFARQNNGMIVDQGAIARTVSEKYPNWNGNGLYPQPILRATVCLAEYQGRNYLIYSLFTRATPVTMAMVLLAYGCQSAMQLDIGDYNETYGAAVQFNRENGFTAMPLNSHNKKAAKNLRFISQPDRHDFFAIFQR